MVRGVRFPVEAARIADSSVSCSGVRSSVGPMAFGIAMLNAFPALQDTLTCGQSRSIAGLGHFDEQRNNHLYFRRVRTLGVKQGRQQHWPANDLDGLALVVMALGEAGASFTVPVIVTQI
jgi:hypothetical protein